MNILDKVVKAYNSDRELDKNDLLEIIAKLQPRKSKKIKSDFDYVAQAVADNKEVREFLRYVYSDGEYLVATSGHRMHYCKADRPEGFYDPRTGLKVECDRPFPANWKLVAKIELSCYDDINVEYQREVKKNKNTTCTINNVKFNEKYIADALNNLNDAKCEVQEFYIKISDGNRNAVVAYSK